MKEIKKLVQKILPYQAYYALKVNPIRRDNKAKAWDKKNGEYYRNFVNAGGRIFMLNIPWHTNLGDLAITEAQIAFLKGIAPNEPIAEVNTLGKNLWSVDALKKIIPKNALLFFNGGGCLHDGWLGGEEAFRRIVELFSDNRIILFPQSIFYSNTKTGNEILKSSQRAYSRHNDLHLFARDKISCDLMKQYHPSTNIYLAPDMTLLMKHSSVNDNRDGVLMCIRSDLEKLITTDDILRIEKISGKYGDVEYTDTVAFEYTGGVNSYTRSPLVNEKLNQFSQARVVITDRLHGMVFAAITGTPCVALSNHNHKIKGLSDWLEHLDYIRYIDNICEFEKAIEAVLNHGPGDFDPNAFLPHYAELEKVILEKI